MQDWKAQLDSFFEQPSAQPSQDPHVARHQTEASQFIKDVAWPAFEEIGQTLRRHGRAFKGEFSVTSATGTVGDQGLSEFQYVIEVRVTHRGAYPHVLTRYERPRGAMSGNYSFRGKRASSVTQDDIGRHFVHAYLKSFKDKAGS
ncbi:MAG: hypothetical protein ACXWQR_02855 [Ktedonobacterales bacterium]